jgi:hypothetical protein
MLFEMKKFFLFMFIASFHSVMAQKTSVLFIGNSFTHMNQMPKTFEKIAESLSQEVYVEMNAKSNHTLKMHSERAELYEAIKSRKWDFVVIQPFSREMIFSEDSVEQATIPFFKQLLDSIYAKNPCTNVMIYQTWGYKDGFQEDSLSNTYERMTTRISEGVMRLSDRYSLPVVPVGMVWNDLIKSGYGNSLYDADGSHPSPEGSYLIACTFYVSLFRKSLDGAFTNGVPATKVSQIHRICYDFVLTNVDQYKLRENSFFVQKVYHKNAPRSIRCKAYYEKADSLIWRFGDGSSSRNRIVKHNYKIPGKYTVVLTVHDKCGKREYRTPIEFIDPKKKKTG